MFKNITDLIGAVATCVGLIITVLLFNQQQKENIAAENRNRINTDAMEFKRQFWTKQADTYSRISDLIGIMVSDYSKPGEVDSAMRKYKVIYYGNSVYVSDSVVIDAMRDFSGVIDSKKKGFFESDPQQFKKKGISMVNTLRESSFRTWKTLNATAQ